MRPPGWNPELFLSPLWETLRALDLNDPPTIVTGEAALAGFWFHHRMVETLELSTSGDLDRLAGQIEAAGGPLKEEQRFPGFVRFRAGPARLDLNLELEPPLDPKRSEEDGLASESLRDLAVDRWLRLLGRKDLKLLVDLYFLNRARVDLLKAARDTRRRDAGCNEQALAVVLHGMKIGPPADWAIRPVSQETLQTFAELLKERLALQTFQ